MEESQSMLKLSVIWRGNKYVVETNSNACLKELGHELLKLTNVKAATMRLIVPQNKGSKLLYPFSDDHSSLSLQEVSVIEGKPIRMMGVFKDEVDKVLQNDKADLRIIGFDEEEKRLRQRMLDMAHTPLKLPQGQFIFCDFRTLQIPGVELNPSASEALKRMHRLAADPGIVAIMNKHHWRVGIMTELAPVGYVGVSPKCVLGLNKNHGEEISLRLRTDDLKGFRKYESIKKTLLHELAHMVYSEHDANFYALDKQLNQEAASLDWTRSAGHTLTGYRHSDHYEDDFYAGDNRNLSQKLGGNHSDRLESARASSVAAAYRRLANICANSVGVPEVHEEPDPDDSGFVMREEFDRMDSVEKENPELVNQNRSDPNDHSGNQNKIEPDPDDPQDLTLEPVKIGKKLAGTNSCEGHKLNNSFSKFNVVAEVMGVDNMLHPRKIVAEPDPDDSKAKQEILEYTNIFRPDYSHSFVKVTLEHKSQCMAHKEPDPDESQANQSQCMAHKEPDPDESQANRVVQGKPDPDESQANQIVQEEPDPDDCQENGTVHEEPDPDDNLVHPQGVSCMEIDEPDPDDQELRRIRDSVSAVCSSLKKAIEMLQAEVNPLEKTTVLQTLFKIIRNVIEHPDEMKYKRLRKANPVIQRNVANYKAALEILYLIGFNEDVVLDEIGKAETYLVLKRNDPGLLWLAKSSLETCITY